MFLIIVTVCVLQYPCGNTEHDVVENKIVPEVVNNIEILHSMHSFLDVVAIDTDWIIERNTSSTTV